MQIDVKELEFIGEGRHGTVYRLDDRRCVKIYKRDIYRQKEYHVLKHSQRFAWFPRVYECKDNYMIREYFEGSNLREYLTKNGFSNDLATKLFQIIDSFIQLGYSRIDCRLSHIIVTEGEFLKVIDPTRNMSKRCSYPRRLLAELNNLGFKDAFLQYTKGVRPDLYELWK